MADNFRVTLVQSPGMSEGERKRRIGRAFDLLLDVGERTDGTTGRAELGGLARPVAGATLTEGAKMQEL